MENVDLKGGGGCSLDHRGLIGRIYVGNQWKLQRIHVYEPRSERRDLLAIKVKSEIFTYIERPSCCEQLQKI